jgi:LmbE family N-acetylglucosaminyl deacetylase
VSDACFFVRFNKDRQLDGERNNLWRPKLVYHYIQWKNIVPDFVDITGFTDKKTEAILAYSSQFYDANSKEPESPITSKNSESLNYRSEI